MATMWDASPIPLRGLVLIDIQNHVVGPQIGCKRLRYVTGWRNTSCFDAVLGPL